MNTRKFKALKNIGTIKINDVLKLTDIHTNGYMLENKKNANFISLELINKFYKEL